MKVATFLLLSVLAGLSSAYGAAEITWDLGKADFVVSPEGNDDWVGTLDQPFASLERARAAVRTLDREKDIVVLLREGYYRLDGTVVFGIEDSAPEGHTITYAAHPGETPILGSGVPISSWEKVESGLPGVTADRKSVV